MLITGDTDPHTDIKIDDLTLEDNEDTVILFLNNNVGAYTKIGEEKIPAVAGTMVSFKGKSVVHHSVVPSGSDIRLLGPFSSRDLAAIGCMPVGSPVPCDGDDSKVVCTAEKGNGDKRCFCGSECTPLNVASCSGACGECTSFSGPAKEAVELVLVPRCSFHQANLWRVRRKQCMPVNDLHCWVDPSGHLCLRISLDVDIDQFRRV